MNQDDINAMDPDYRDNMNYLTGGTYEGTWETSQILKTIQEQNGGTACRQQPGESSDHYLNRS